MTYSEKKNCWLSSILLIPYGLGFYLSLMQISGFFVTNKGIADPTIPGFNLINSLSITISNFLPLTTDLLYLSIIIVTILASLITPLYLFTKNIYRHFSGWLFVLNLIISAPTLLLIFIGVAMNI